MMPIIFDAMIFNMDSLSEITCSELILRQQRNSQLLKQKKLMQTQEDHSNPIPALNVDSLKNVKSKRGRCMTYFRSLHSHLQVLSKDDLKGTRIEHGFKRAFMSLFGQDVDTFTRTMLLNVDQLQKQLDKDEFQEDGSMTAFWVVNNQFQKFIDSKFTLDYDSQMTDTYFVEYTGIEVQHFRDTLLQHLGNVKKSVAERTRHQRQYERRVNKRQVQTQESKIDTGKALDADLVNTESIRTDSIVQDDSSRSGNDTDADDADIRPIYDEEPMAEVQLTAECNIFAIGQQHTEQPEIINEGQHGQILNETSNKAKIEKEIDVLETMNIELEHSVATLRKENETLKQHYKDLYDSIKITRSKTTEQTTSLLANNAELKAQIQEKVFAIAALKNELRKLKGNSVDTKFDKTSVLGKPMLPSLRNQSVVRQPNAFKSERAQMSKQRNSSKNMPRFSSNDMVHNHYLDEARKKTQERDGNSKTSVMPSARFQTTVDGSKPKPRSNNQTSRSLPMGSNWKDIPLAQPRLTVNPPNGSNEDITNNDECAQTLDSVLVSKEVHQVAETVTTSNELDLLFDPLFRRILMEKIQAVLKYSAVIYDASNKRQQQPDSTSSTSTLATTVTADGNFDL
ncbi:hypothetical protein Tco_1311212 [Tanacetum coccineum]